MRGFVLDYSGHPFQVQLSRSLAARGLTITHAHFAGFQTPKGNLARQNDDPAGFEALALHLPSTFAKHSFVKRRRQEIAFGRIAAQAIVAARPDFVLSSNVPLDAQAVIQRACRDHGIRFVFWLQDIYSAAIERVLTEKIPVLGRLIGRRYRALEYRLFRQSDHIVAIADDFRVQLLREGIPGDRISVIENWANLDELSPQPRDNAWASAHLAADKVRVVYSGTLGFKHNPDLLVDIAARLPHVHVHVFSEGPVADHVTAAAAARGVANVSVAGWVAYRDLADMLGGADIVVAMIEREAGVYSVPSKVLTYLSVGRAIVAAVPAANLAAAIIARAKAGLVSEPGDIEATIAHVQRLAGDPAARAAAAAAGRAYALEAFDIEAITDRFMPILRGEPTRTMQESETV